MRFDGLRHAHVLGHHASVDMVGRLIRRDLPGAEQFGNHRMVFAELLEPALAQAVDAAVAHVGNVDAITGKQGQDQGRPHPDTAALAVALTMNVPALVENRLSQQASDRATVARSKTVQAEFDDRGKILCDRRGRDSPATMAPHPVHDEEQPCFGLSGKGILIVLAQPANIAGGRPEESVRSTFRCAQRLDHRHLPARFTRPDTACTTGSSPRTPCPRTTCTGHRPRRTGERATACEPSAGTTDNTA